MGKGTHCKRLVGDCDATHVSVGDLLRAEAEKPEAKDKTIIQGRMQEGSLAPTNLVGKVLEGFLVHMVKGGHRKFLVDGFPRSMEQALDFESRVSIQSRIICSFQDRLEMLPGSLIITGLQH